MVFHQMTVRGEEGVAVHLDASRDDFIFVCLVIYCIVWEHWGKVAIAIDSNLDPIHQEKARDCLLFSSVSE